MPAFILPFLFKALGIGKAFLGWLRSLSPQALIILALCALLAVQTFRVNHTAKQRDRALTGLKTAQATIADFKHAQAEAEAIQTHNLTVVAKQQDVITERVSHDFETRLADARARYERLRQSSVHSSTSNDNLPAASQGASSTVEAPANGFPDAERLEATEIALQLDALIDWVEAQSAVPTSPETPK